MTRTKILLLSAAFALAFASASPAFALNPQPLPPGYAMPKIPHITVKCVTGQHMPR